MTRHSGSLKFVPTNAALSSVNIDEVDDLNAFLTSHAISGKRKTGSLQGGQNIPSLAAGHFIHITTVQGNRKDASHSRSGSHSKSKRSDEGKQLDKTNVN